MCLAEAMKLVLNLLIQELFHATTSQAVEEI